MPLSADLRRQLYDALVDALTASEIDTLAFFCGNHAECALGDGTDDAKLVRLISWMEKREKVEELLEAATGLNPNNPKMQAVRSAIAVTRRAAPPLSGVPVRSGIGALGRLIDNPLVRLSVDRTRTTLKETHGKLLLVRSYKIVHDVLHDIQKDCYEQLELELHAACDDSFENLEVHCDSYCLYVDQLTGVVTEAILPAQETAFIPRQLCPIGEEWRRALAERNLELLGRTRNRLKVALSTNQSFVDRLLYSTATNMLPSFLAALQEISSAVPVSNGAESLQFADGLTRLAALNKKLNELIECHHDWQNLENEMRRISEFLPDIAQELLDSPILWDLPASLAYPPQYARVQIRHCKLKEALDSRDGPNISKQFLHLRKLASDVFYGVDKSLKAQCDELPGIAFGLQSLLEST